MICPTTKAEYFLSEDWTGQITLIRLDKSGCARKTRRYRTSAAARVGYADAHPPDGRGFAFNNRTVSKGMSPVPASEIAVASSQS
jgi:hypothetical protein